MSKKKTDAAPNDPHRQIPSTPSNESLYEFLSGLFWIEPNDAAPGAVKTGFDHFPERLVLRTVFNVGAQESVGPVVHQEEFRPMSDAAPKPEALCAMSNRFDSICQREASSASRRLVFTLQAHSSAKGSEPYSRMLIAKSPGEKELANIADVPLEHQRQLEEKEQQLKHERFNQMLMAQMTTDYRTAMQELVGMYERRLIGSETANQELLKLHVTVVSLKEDLLDRSAKRQLEIKKQEMKDQWMQKGMGLLEGFAIPLALQKMLGPERAAQAMAAAGTMRSPPTQQPQVQTHPLVQQLFQMLGTLDAQQEHKLFGEWNENKSKQITPGILSEQQCALLGGLSRGELHPSHLKIFVSSMTPEQQNAAREVLNPEQTTQLIAIAMQVASIPNEPPTDVVQ